MRDGRVEHQVAIAHKCRKVKENFRFKRHPSEPLTALFTHVGKLREDMLAIEAAIAVIGGPLNIDDGSLFSDL